MKPTPQPDHLKPLAWLLFLAALAALTLTITGCVLDDPAMNAALAQGTVIHFENVASTPSRSSIPDLARLKAINASNPTAR